MKDQPQLIPARMLPTEKRHLFLTNGAIKQVGWRYATMPLTELSVPVTQASGFRVRCGLGHTWGTANPCAGNLGEAWRFSDVPVKPLSETDDLRRAMEHAGRRDEFWELLHDENVWILIHNEHLREQDGIFVVMRGKTSGRRPLPSNMQLPRGPRLPDGRRDTIKFGIVGDLAILPLTIKCPRCHRLNSVPAPLQSDDSA